jgi:WD40 repeat protein
MWAKLGAGLRWDVYAARWGLVQASDEGVGFLEGKVRRARAVSATQVGKLAALLDDDSPEVRRKAYAELEALGGVAGPALGAVLRARPTAELAYRAELLQKAWAQPHPAQALLILEQINTPRARALLMGLAAGKHDAPLTQGALAALRRMKSRPPDEPLKWPGIEFPAAGIEVEVTAAPPGPGKAPPLGTDLSGNPLPKGALARVGTPKVRDEKDIETWRLKPQACCSPDGKALLTLREDGAVRFWDRATGRPLRAIRLKGVSLSLMALMPDGTALACAGRDEQAKPILALLGTAKGEVRWAARLPEGQVSFLAVSGDGKVVAWAVDDEVRLWAAKTGRELRRLVGHRDTVRVGAFSPDGKLLVTSSENVGLTASEDVRVWDVRTGRELRRLDGHAGHLVRALAFSADGKTLASVGRDDFLGLWDTGALRRARLFPLPSGWAGPFAFSPDGKTVVVGESKQTLSLRDARTGKLLRRLDSHSGIVHAAFFAPDGKALVSVNLDDTALVWKWPSDVEAEAERPRAALTDVLGSPLPPGALARMGSMWLRHPTMMFDFAVSPDGKQVAAGGGVGDDPGVYVWGLETGKERRQLGGGSVLYSPDGKWLANTGGRAISLLEPATGEQAHYFSGHLGGVSSFAFSPDGKTLAVGGGDRDHPDKSIRLLDVVSGRERSRLEGHWAPSSQVVFAPDGRSLFSFTEETRDSKGQLIKGNFCVWSTVSGKLLRRGPLPGPAPVLSPDGRMFSYKETKTRLVVADLASGKRLARFDGTEDIRGLFSPDRKHFLVIDGASPLSLRALPDGRKVRQLARAPIWGRPVRFSPDGKKLVLSSHDMRQWSQRWQRFDESGLRIWDIATDTEVRPVPGHRDAVTCLAFSPDMGMLVTGSSDETLRLWDAKSGRELRALGPQGRSLTSVAFAPDGRTLASADNNGTLRLWAPATGKQLARVGGHTEGIASLAFTPDGKSLLLINGKGEVVLRDAMTAKELRRHKVREDLGAALAVSQDASVVVSARKGGFLEQGVPCGLGGPLLFWDRETARVLAKVEGENNEFFRSAVFSPDGRTVAVFGGVTSLFNARDDKAHLRLFEVATGRQVFRLDQPAGPHAFSPDGRFLAVGASLWDLATVKHVGHLKGHRGEVQSLAFSPDGARLATGSTDTTALVWRRSALFPAGNSPKAPLPLADLWADLAGPDAARAHASSWRLALSPDRALPFLGKRLRPATGPSAARLARLIADLGSDTFAVRKRAEEALEEHGELAEAAIRAALKGKPPLETHRRLEGLLEKLDVRRTSPRRLQSLRSIAVLERIGTREARAVLEALARGAAGAWQTGEAKAALRRLARRGGPAERTK